jgi:hypothetical protein
MLLCCAFFKMDIGEWVGQTATFSRQAYGLGHSECFPIRPVPMNRLIERSGGIPSLLNQAIRYLCRHPNPYSTPATNKYKTVACFLGNVTV